MNPWPWIKYWFAWIDYRIIGWRTHWRPLKPNEEPGVFSMCRGRVDLVEPEEECWIGWDPATETATLILWRHHCAYVLGDDDEWHEITATEN